MKTKNQLQVLALAAVVTHIEELASNLDALIGAIGSSPATPEQVSELESLQNQMTEAQEVRAEKETAAKKQEELLASARRSVDAAAELSKPIRQTTAARITGGDKPGASKNSWGFQNEGEFIIAARNFKTGKRDPRIMNAATTFGSEGVNEEGGFTVPPDYRTNIRKAIEGEGSLAALCDDQRTSSNRLSFPIDENAPWDSSSGMTVGYLAEGATITASKPKLGSLETKLVKLGALVPLTEELIEDASAMTAYVSTKVPEKTVAFLNQEIINGAGSPGTLLGILNAAAKVTVAAKSGQGANTVVADNIAKMWSSLPVKSRARAVWLVHSDVEAVLPVMTIANQPVYLPPGGLLERSNGTLMGRPVIVCEDCKALGTEGDIILWDPLEYIIATKTGPSGMRADVSMHVYFEQDLTAMRFVQRIGGQPWWTKSFARKNGSSSQSPILTLNSTRT